jgi:hypothetical protein
MQKHQLLVLLGVVALVVGLILFSQTDAWSRSWAQVTLLAGIIFSAVGLGAWAVIDALQQQRRS